MKEGWLRDVLAEAKRCQWCTKPRCTTCGSLEFRLAVRNGTIAAASAAPDRDIEAQGSPEKFAHLPETSALVAELRLQSAAEVAANIDAVRTILMTANLGVLEIALRGCAVGSALDAMVAHS